MTPLNMYNIIASLQEAEWKSLTKTLTVLAYGKRYSLIRVTGETLELNEGCNPSLLRLARVYKNDSMVIVELDVKRRISGTRINMRIR